MSRGNVLAIYKLQLFFFFAPCNLINLQRAGPIYIWRKLFFISLHSVACCGSNSINPAQHSIVHRPSPATATTITRSSCPSVIQSHPHDATKHCNLFNPRRRHRRRRTAKSCTRMALLSKLLNHSPEECRGIIIHWTRSPDTVHRIEFI